MSLHLLINSLIGELDQSELSARLNETIGKLKEIISKLNENDSIAEDSIAGDSVEEDSVEEDSIDKKSMFRLYAKTSNEIDLLQNIKTLVDETQSLVPITAVEKTKKLSSKILMVVGKRIESLYGHAMSHYSSKATACKTIDEFLEVRKTFYKLPTTIELYVTFAQKTIDYLYSTNKQDMFKVLSMIEADKDKFLPDVEQKYTASIYKNQPPIKRFGLMPICESDKLDVILSNILPDASGKIDMERYAAKHKVGFIIIISSVYTPIEYGARLLYNKELFKKLEIDGDAGVNGKVLALFGTIKSMTADKKSSRQKWEMSMKIINEDASNFYILESLENSTKDQQFRALAPWLYSSNALVSRHKIESLLSYINDPHATDRITKYQKICMDNALRNMFEHIPVDLEAAMERGKSIDIHVVRNRVYIELRGIIHNLIKKIKPKTDADVNDIIHDKKLSTKLRLLIMELKKMAGHIDHGFLAGELLTGYVIEANYTVRRAMKELHNEYNRNPLKEINEDIVQTKLDELLMNVTNRIFGENDNIFASLQLKQILLTYGTENAF